MPTPVVGSGVIAVPLEFLIMYVAVPLNLSLSTNPLCVYVQFGTAEPYVVVLLSAVIVNGFAVIFQVALTVTVVARLPLPVAVIV